MHHKFTVSEGQSQAFRLGRVHLRPGTLRIWASKRRVPFVRVCRLVKFRKEDLDRWIDKNRVEVER